MGWAGNLWYMESFAEEPSAYAIYVGLNDKDTNVQETPTEELQKQIDEICGDYVEGFSCSEMSGGWASPDGTFVREQTLVYQFMGVTEETVMQMMDKILMELNQECILWEKKEGSYGYYYGDEKEK